MHTKSSIQALIATNDQAVIRAVLAIYKLQTPQEQAYKTTVEDNGFGFSGADAVILSSFAVWYQSEGFLSPKQLEIARKKIRRYWRQLLQIIEAAGNEVSYSRTK